jgi:hypothetical protein
VASAFRHRIAGSVCAVWLAGMAVAHADPSTRLRLIVDAAGVLSPVIRANLISEASRIWSKEHVSLVTEDDGHCLATDPETVAVRIDVGNDTQSGDAGLGAIRFSPDGRPESVIALNLDSVVRIATSAPVMGVHPALWPAGLRQEIIARALGRALAHEIGHYLLRSPHHTSSGLMQARYKGSAIGNPSDRLFALTSPDRARLRIALAAPLDHEPVCPILATR